MMRYFFDYRDSDRSLLDYNGQEFHNSRSAVEFAEAIVHDLMHTITGDWAGWSVEVRNAEGRKVASFEIGRPSLFVN